MFGGGSGIFPNRELVMVDLCFKNHSDCTVENRWKRGKTRGREPVRRQFLCLGER